MTKPDSAPVGDTLPVDEAGAQEPTPYTDPVKSMMDDEAAIVEEPARRRRGWTRWLAIGVSALLVLLLVALGGAGWYFSGQVVDVVHGPHSYPYPVVAVDDDTVTLPNNHDTTRVGVWGLDWGDGRAVIGEITDINPETVTRRLLEGDRPTEGTDTRIDTWAYATDPQTDFGLTYSTVDIEGKLGKFPAWYVPADGDTWVIAVHGRNASPGEALRALPRFHESGFPLLSVTHRNDVGAPDSPDGLHHLGATEWEDVSAAVDYAVDNGARSVVLAGWSMGGAVVMSTLRNMDDPGLVAGVVLDSPVLDWSSTLDKQGELRSLPGILTDVAKLIVEWRVDVDLDDLDQRLIAADLTTPILLYCDIADETVAADASLEFAEAVPAELMTLVTTEVGHTASWNEDPEAYEAALATFLARL